MECMMTKKFDPNAFDNAGAWDDMGGTVIGSQYSGSGSGGYKLSCYYSHPALQITDPVDGVVYKIYGGNCSSPAIHDADIYIGFAGGATNPNKLYPWESGYKQVQIFDYYINDMQPPKDAVTFHQLVDWTCNQLRAGKKIHGGCIGGHGRTGMWLVAVYKQMTGDPKAIQYVREHYCKKAVETTAQVKFLVEEFGVESAPDVKKPVYSYPTKGGTTWDNFGKGGGKSIQQGSSGSSTKQKSIGFSGAKRTLNAVESDKCIW